MQRSVLTHQLHHLGQLIRLGVLRPLADDLQSIHRLLVGHRVFSFVFGDSKDDAMAVVLNPSAAEGLLHHVRGH